MHNVTFRTKMIRQNFILLLCQCQTAALMGLVYKTKKKKTLLPSYIFLLHLIKPQRRHSSVRGRCSRVILLLRHLCHLNSITFSTSPPNHPPPDPPSRNLSFFSFHCKEFLLTSRNDIFCGEINVFISDLSQI